MATVTTKNTFSLPDGEHLIADNLYLVVRGTSRSFMFRYVAPNGARRRISMGPAKKISLAEARAEANRCRVLLAKGIDPKDVRSAEKERLRAASRPDPRDVTVGAFFVNAFDEYIKVRCVRDSTAKSYRSASNTIILPLFGESKIRDLTTKNIAEALKEVWFQKPVAAPIARLVLENILNIAIREGIIEANPAIWRGGLAMYLPAPGKFHETTHKFAISLKDLQASMPALIKSGRMGGIAATVIALTACRLREVTFARWEEICLEDRTFTIPPERRKDGFREPHRVPLSTQAIKLIRALPHETELVFQGTRDKRPVSIHGPNYHLRKITGNPEASIHGLRSTFAQWAAEKDVDFEIREACLMHAVGNKVTRAYQRSDLLDRRREVMQSWADTILPMDVLEAALTERS